MTKLKATMHIMYDWRVEQWAWRVETKHITCTTSERYEKHKDAVSAVKEWCQRIGAEVTNG